MTVVSLIGHKSNRTGSGNGKITAYCTGRIFEIHRNGMPVQWISKSGIFRFKRIVLFFSETISRNLLNRHMGVIS